MHIPALSYPGPLSKLRATTSPHHFACSSRPIVLYILSNSTYRERKSKPHTSLNLRTHTGQTCRHPMTSPRNVCEITAFCGKKKEIIKKEKERKRKEKTIRKEEQVRTHQQKTFCAQIKIEPPPPTSSFELTPNALAFASPFFVAAALFFFLGFL